MEKGGRAMKRLLFLGLGSALMFTMGGVGPAQADGGPHISSSQIAGASVTIASAGAGKCASCHRAHTAKAGFLLLQAQPALCYTCHDGTGVGVTDVIDGVSPGGQALRGGGFVSAAISSGAATKVMGPESSRQVYGLPSTAQNIPALATGLAVTSKHLIDGVTAGIAWGNGAIDSTGANVGKSLTLQCGSCHDPHGNGNFRLLKPIPVGSDTAAVAAVTANPTAVPPVVGVAAVAAVVVAPINIPDQPVKAYTTLNYWDTSAAGVPLNATALTNGSQPVGVTDGYIQNVAAWCTTCHTRYLAPTGSYKTASGDATFMYRHRSDANYKAGAANCITCHVSHGSNAVMTQAAAKVGVPGGPAVLGTGITSTDSRLLRVDNRGTCVMCHNV